MRPSIQRPWRVFLALALALVPIVEADPDPDFAQPAAGRRFAFPRDHGSHPEFALEWWYVTGHLYETNGLRHGFQATFFRRSTPRHSDAATPATPAFGDDQLHLAHMAFLEGASGRFLHQERLNRDGWDAAASTNHLDVRNGNWSLRGGAGSAGNLSSETLELRGGVRAEAAWTLSLSSAKPLAVFGTNGVSRKAAEPWASSHYLTFTRLTVSGTLTLDGRLRRVQGEAWMDHEFSSSQLGAGQVGWDWAGIQLNDGREIMAYRMRRADGITDPFSTLAWVDREGAVRHIGPASFRWEAEGRWRSPETGAEYPARIRLTAEDPASGRPLTLQLIPIQAAQELTGGLGGIAYWEGACRVLNAEGREIGSAFLEMTGYAAPLSGRL